MISTIKNQVQSVQFITYSELLSAIGIEISQMLEVFPECIDVSTGDAAMTLISGRDILTSLEENDYFAQHVIEECPLIEENRKPLSEAEIELLQEQWESFEKLLKEMDDNNIYIDMEN